MINIVEVNVSPTTDHDLKAFDHTTLAAINTCPTWGLLRYHLGKSMRGTGRQMALEAGGAAHEVFSAHRLYNLYEYGPAFYNIERDELHHIVRSTGYRLFGEERFGEMLDAVNPREDYRTRCQQFSLTALYNCGFYDDPTDKRKTTTNVEETCLAYMDRYDWKNELPVIIGDFIGIEIPIDVTIEFILSDGTVVRYRFIGRADGLHYSTPSKQAIRLHENKTASRLNDAWELSFETSHQVTGYLVGLSAMIKLPISQAIILGASLPMPKSYADGLLRIVVNRYEFQLSEWFQWFWHTSQIYEQYKSDVVNAPKYTISCNRYFRPCSFIPFCAVPPEDRQDIIDGMVDDMWSPLHDKYGAVQDE